MRNLIFLVVLLAVGWAFPAEARAALSLNEIMADPASDWDGDGVYGFREDEWVEILNPGPGAVDLSGYRLSDNGGLWTYGFAAGTQLAPGAALVVYGSQSVEWQGENDEPLYGFQMSNDGDTVCLWHLSAADTLLVDTHTLNTYEADDDRSTGRHPDGTGVWEIFDALNPYGGSEPPLGNGLAPTPGLPNSGEPPTAAQGETWGRVKGMFR